MTSRPDLSLRELLDDWRAKRGALELIAEAVEALKDPPEAMRSIGVVAREALGPASR